MTNDYFDKNYVELKGKVEDPDGLFERLKKEMQLSEEAQQKLIDVCKYMFEHKISKISLGFAQGSKFNLTMSDINEEAGND